MAKPGHVNSGRAGRSTEDLDQEIARIALLDRAVLIADFEHRFGHRPPSRLSTHLLRLSLAYQVQAQQHGGLRAELRKSLLLGKPPATTPSASAGTVLIREWQGREHTVVVHADHVAYGKERFRSLTEVTHRITGQKRSGPAFFGLRSKPHV